MAIVRLRPEDLKRAIAGGTLSLQFQPQVHVPTGKLVGAEAFARWPHPSYGMIGPGEIIALIEQGALHVEFDRWVLTELCAQQVRWQEESFDVPIVAANIWTQTLRARKVIDLVRDVVMRSGARPGAIEIECPRGTVGDRALAETARRLRVLGLRVASKEFGHREVAKAARDFDTLKIGYPLARDVVVAGTSAPDAVSAIVAAGREAGARVVADSVETPEQENALTGFGCEIVQGYLYGPEVSAAELKLLAAVGAKRAE